jgi:ankyrin repeat protein
LHYDLRWKATKSFEDINDDLETDEQFKDSLKALCGLLLGVHDGRVYLIHQTAREFLTQTTFSLGNAENSWQGPISPMLAESTMSKACISILSLKDFQAQPPWASLPMRFYEIEERIGQWIDKYTFLRYAAEYWVEHFKARQDSLDANLLEIAAQICRAKSSYFWTWYPILCASLYEDVEEEQTDFAFPSRSGLFAIVKVFINEGVDFTAPCGPYGNALHAASAGGHESVVQQLLEKGADVNAQGGHYGNALQAASFKGHEVVVQLLLEEGANINAQGGEYGNALQAASYAGLKSVVELLIEKDVDVNSQGGRFGNALQAASFKGHEAVVQLLLEKGADINAQGGVYQTALRAASCGRNESVVRLLLNEGADINAESEFYGDALHDAISQGRDSVVKFLLEKT